MHPQWQVEAVMRSWYRLVCLTSRKKHPVVAFKGGHYELDIRVAMNIPTCNLENWGCPKVEEVATLFPEVKADIHMCYRSNHTLASNDSVVHCPRNWR